MNRSVAEMLAIAVLRGDEVAKWALVDQLLMERDADPRLFQNKLIEGRIVSGYEVWSWPEFQRFIERLGVARGLPTVDLVIEMPLEGAVEIHQRYQARSSWPRTVALSREQRIDPFAQQQGDDVAAPELDDANPDEDQPTSPQEQP